MKFTIRRAIVGVVSIPLLAGAYVFFYLLLLLAGAEPAVTLTESFNNGLLIGITSAVFFTFAPRILHIIDRITFSS